MKYRWGNMQLTLSDEEPPVLPKTSCKHWHKSNLEYAYGRCIQEFEHYGFSPEDIERLRVEQLSAKEFKTSSDRIRRMIVTAFYVGKMCGIRESDEMSKHTTQAERRRPNGTF